MCRWLFEQILHSNFCQEAHLCQFQSWKKMPWGWPDMTNVNVTNVPTHSQSILSKLGKICQKLTVENGYNTWKSAIDYGHRIWSPPNQLLVGKSQCFIIQTTSDSYLNTVASFSVFCCFTDCRGWPVIADLTGISRSWPHLRCCGRRSWRCRIACCIWPCSWGLQNGLYHQALPHPVPYSRSTGGVAVLFNSTNKQ